MNQIQTLPTDAKRSRRGKPRGPCWTEKEHDILVRYMRLGWPPEEIQRHLPRRTIAAINYKRGTLSRIIKNTGLPLDSSNGSAGGPRVVSATSPRRDASPSTAPEEPVPGKPPAALSRPVGNYRGGHFSTITPAPLDRTKPALNAKTYALKSAERCQFPLNDSWPYRYCGKKRAHRLSPYCTTCMQRAYTIQPLYMRDAA